MYELRLTMAETSFFGGKVKIVGLVFDAFGAFAETPPPSSAEANKTSMFERADALDMNEGDIATNNGTTNTTYEDDYDPLTWEERYGKIPLGHDVDLADLHWDGELTGSLVMSDAAGSDVVPRVEGSFSVAAAWTSPPPSQGGQFTLKPMVARGEVRARFGGSPNAPTVLITARAAFPIPCNLGHAFRASGSLVMRRLGGAVSGALQMAATYYCGQRPDLRLAEFNAQLDEPIVIAGLMKLTKMNVVGTVFRKTKEAVEADLGASAGADTTDDDDDDVDVDDDDKLTSASGTAEGDDDEDDETRTSNMKGSSGDGGGYFTEGVIAGEVELLGSLDGLTISAGVWFDTSAGAAEIVAAVQYVQGDEMSLDLKARFPVGYCDERGSSMVGTAIVNAAPLDTLVARASVVKHCEEAIVATKRYGHVWLIELAVDELEAFDGALVGSDIHVKVVGRQVGLQPGGKDSGLTWSLEAGGTIAIGDGVKSKLPAALKSVELSATFKVGVLLKLGTNEKAGDEDTAANTTNTTETAVLGAELAKKTKQETGLQYFDINATAGIEAGHDPITNGPIFKMRATMSFAYPCTRPLTVDANASITNLGGAKGLTIDDVRIALVFFCDAGPSDVQMTFKASVQSVVVGGVNLGKVSIAANAFVRPNNNDTTSATLGDGGGTLAASPSGAGQNSNNETDWYWKGVVNVEASFSTGGVEGDVGAQLSFNTLTNDLKVVVTFRLETDTFLLHMKGETATYCEDSGTFLVGTIVVKAGALPFPLPTIMVSASKFCKPYSPSVYFFSASMDINELAGIGGDRKKNRIIEDDAEKASKKSPQTPAKTVKVKISVPSTSAPEAVHDVLQAIKSDMKAKGMTGVGAELQKTIRMSLTLEDVTKDTWDSMEPKFIHELSERMTCEPEDIILDVHELEDGLEILVEMTKMTAAPFSRRDAALGAVRLARMGDDYGVAGALAAASKSIDIKPPVYRVTSLHPHGTAAPTDITVVGHVWVEDKMDADHHGAGRLGAASSSSLSSSSSSSSSYASYEYAPSASLSAALAAHGLDDASAEMKHNPAVSEDYCSSSSGDGGGELFILHTACVPEAIFDRFAHGPEGAMHSRSDSATPHSTIRRAYVVGQHLENWKGKVEMREVSAGTWAACVPGVTKGDEYGFAIQGNGIFASPMHDAGPRASSRQFLSLRGDDECATTGGVGGEDDDYDYRSREYDGTPQTFVWGTCSRQCPDTPSAASSSSSAVSTLGDDGGGGGDDDAAKLNSEWLTFKELVISLKARKLAATDSDESADLAWELEVAGGFSFKNTADSPVPSFLPLTVELDLAYRKSWLGDGLKKLAEEDSSFPEQMGDTCVGRGTAEQVTGAACGKEAGNKVCPLAYACIEKKCVNPLLEEEFAALFGEVKRDEVLAKTDLAHSYNANHSCTVKTDVPVEGSALAVRGEITWEMEGFKLWGYADFLVPCTSGEQIFKLKMDFDMWQIQVIGADVEARLSCAQKVKRHTKMFSLEASVKRIAVWRFALSDVAVHVEGFSRVDAQSGGVEMSDMYFRGKASGHFKIIEGLDTIGFVRWDTLSGKVQLGLEVHYETWVGDTRIELDAVGFVSTSCTKMGDFYLRGEAKLSNVPKLGDVYGSATFESDCGDFYKFTIELRWSDPKINMGGFIISVPDWVMFRVAKTVPHETEVMFAMPFGRKAILRMTFFLPIASGGWQLEFYFKAGSLCDALYDFLSLIPVLRIDPCGWLRGGPLSFLASILDWIKYTKLVLRLAVKNAMQYFVAYVEGIKIFDIMTLNMGILIGVPDDGGVSASKEKENDNIMFLDIVNDFVSPPRQLPDFMRIPLGMVLKMMSVFKRLGIISTNIRFLEPPGPARDLFPKWVFDLEKGYTLMLVLNIASSTGEGSAEMLETTENSGSGKDTAFDDGMAENTKKEELEEFAIMIPFTKTSICLGHSFRMVNPYTGQLGLPMGDDVLFVAFKPLICIAWGPPALGIKIEATQYIGVDEAGSVHSHRIRV